MEQADADAAKGRITYAESLDAISTADIVIEAAVENAEIKKSIFADLDNR
jgi:3-hydroxybutyryl-CoA dehydrogenase